MKASSFFGYKCPECGSKVDLAVIIGSTNLHCPNCGTAMKPDLHGKVSTANVYCPDCRIGFGLVNSDKCPRCGRPFSKWAKC